MKLNITKGVQSVAFYGDYQYSISTELSYEEKECPQEEDAANADLIHEAFNVANETGLTPRELWGRLSAANKLLREHGLIQPI